MSEEVCCYLPVKLEFGIDKTLNVVVTLGAASSSELQHSTSTVTLLPTDKQLGPGHVSLHSDVVQARLMTFKSLKEK